MNTIIWIVLCITLQIKSQNITPKLCDKSLNATNMFDRMFNINDDIYVIRKEWIFKVRRFSNDTNDGRMTQIGKTMKISELFPNQKDIRIAIAYPTKYVNCGWKKSCNNNEPKSRPFCCLLLKDSVGEWSLYTPNDEKFAIASMDSQYYSWIKDVSSDSDNKYHSCFIVFDEHFDRAEHIVKCTNNIGAIYYQTVNTSKNIHYFINQQMIRQTIKYEEILIAHEWGKSHWKLFRCNETDIPIDSSTSVYSTVDSPDTTDSDGDGDADTDGDSVTTIIFVIIGVTIIIIAIVTLLVMCSKKGFESESEGTTQMSNMSGMSMSSIGAVGSVRSALKPKNKGKDKSSSQLKDTSAIDKSVRSSIKPKSL